MSLALAGKLALMFSAGGILAGLSWWRPMIGLSAYLASVGLDYLLAVIGFNTSGLFSIGQGMLVILVMISAVRWITNRTAVPVGTRKLFWRISLLLGAIWASAICGVWPEHSFFKALVLSATATLPLVLFILIDSTARLELLIWAVGLGVALSGAVGCLQYAGVLQTIGSEERATADDARGAATVYRANGGGVVQGKRYAGPTNNPNGFGVVLMGGIPPLFYLMSSQRAWLKRILALSALCVCGFALLLTMSRTHILGFFIFLILVTLLDRQRNVVAMLCGWCLLLMGGAVFIFALFQIEGVGDRLLAGLNGGDNSSDTRQAVMLGGLKAWAANPLLGIGLNNTEVAGFNPTGNASHDIVSTLLGELGGVGTLAFIVVIAQAFRLLSPVRIASELGLDSLERVSAFTKAALFACLLIGLGDPVLDGRALWIWIGIGTVIDRLTNARLEELLAEEEAGESDPEELVPELSCGLRAQEC
jgi:hypothetical protein